MFQRNTLLPASGYQDRGNIFPEVRSINKKAKFQREQILKISLKIFGYTIQFDFKRFPVPSLKK
jgi:hypothetical protein